MQDRKILKNSAKFSGFTLVELSIVIVIIGIIAGGIILGINLTSNSRIVAVITELNHFKGATLNFYRKYQQVPGDMYNATSVLGAGTVNGNGNMMIEHASSFLGDSEEHRVWQHLSMADLIKGEYTYVAGNLSNITKTKIEGYYRMSYQSNVYQTSGNMISLNGLKNNIPNGPIFTPDEMSSLDAKMDDGSADTGMILGFNEQGVPGCVTNYYTAGSGSYLTGDSEKLCKLFLVLDKY